MNSGAFVDKRKMLVQPISSCSKIKYLYEMKKLLHDHWEFMFLKIEQIFHNRIIVFNTKKRLFYFSIQHMIKC